MKLLHLDSSVLGPHSVSRQVSAAVVERLRQAHPGLETVYRDLTATPLGHLTGLHLAAGQGAAPEPSLREDIAAGQAVLDEFLAADIVVAGDICDRNAVAAAVHGVRYVVHVAADYRLWSPDPDEIIRTNVEGTRAVMEEALRAGVERIVYTSSVATLELRDDQPADETCPLPASRAIGAYKTSKVIA